MTIIGTTWTTIKTVTQDTPSISIPPNGEYTITVVFSGGLKTLRTRSYECQSISPNVSINGLSSPIGGCSSGPCTTVTISTTTSGGGTGCLEENTLINMYNGTVKKVIDIKVGDELQSFSIDGSSNIEKQSLLWWGNTISGKNTSSVVKNVRITTSIKYFNINNGLIKCTDTHIFLIQDEYGIYRWCSALYLKLGYKFFTKDYTLIPIKTIAVIYEKINIVQIDVEEVDNFFIDCGVLSHNKVLL